MTKISYARLKEVIPNEMSRMIMPRAEVWQILDQIWGRLLELEDPSLLTDNEINNLNKIEESIGEVQEPRKDEESHARVRPRKTKK